MDDKNYLSYDEQFKKILNNEEISRIKDDKLREIRAKYWRLRHEAFLDEHNISDAEIGNVFDHLCEVEQKEIESYIKSQEDIIDD